MCLACTEPSSAACSRTKVVMSSTFNAARSKWSRGYFCARKRSTNGSILRSGASARPRSSRRYRRCFSSNVSRALGAASTLRRDVTPCSRRRSSRPEQCAHIFRRYSLPALQVAPITLDYVLIELFCSETLLLKPTIEMPDQPELDSAMDPRIAVGGQPGCKQIAVPR
jgi:hypothetical protein